MKSGVEKMDANPVFNSDTGGNRSSFVLHWKTPALKDVR
jgi:hypothetical protein